MTTQQHTSHGPLHGRRALAWTLALMLALSTPWAHAQTAAKVDDSDTAKALRKLPRAASARPVVAIYEFRSATPDVQVKAAQEMFMTALVNSGAFAVAERQRLNEGIMRERQLQTMGTTTGDAANQKLAGANYIFEVVVSETNVGARDSGGSLGIGGAQISTGGASDQIGMDVRVVDAASGLLVGAVNVVKPIEASSTSVSGLGKLASALASLKGKVIPLDVDLSAHSSNKEGVDRALRSCIEAAVAELAKRLSQD